MLMEVLRLKTIHSLALNLTKKTRKDVSNVFLAKKQVMPVNSLKI